jgi:hypothetical protein
MLVTKQCRLNQYSEMRETPVYSHPSSQNGSPMHYLPYRSSGGGYYVPNSNGELENFHGQGGVGGRYPDCGGSESGHLHPKSIGGGEDRSSFPQIGRCIERRADQLSKVHASDRGFNGQSPSSFTSCAHSDDSRFYLENSDLDDQSQLFKSEVRLI